MLPQRASELSADRPFSVAARAALSHDFRLTIGASAAKPYEASCFNISAMSFGALGRHAVRALNKGAKLGYFVHDTGEGGVRRDHREAGGDLIWKIGSGYFGCRDSEGRFDPGKFGEMARDPQVRATAPSTDSSRSARSAA